jgi:hypothetical protein
MNTNTIDCPKCLTKIEISKAMTAQLTDHIRQELQAGMEAQKDLLEKQANDLAARDKSLADEKSAMEAARANLARAQAEMDRNVKQAIAEGVDAAVATQRATITAQARKKAEADLAEERRVDSERINDLEGKLKQSNQAQLDLIKRERALKEKAEAMELDIARRINEQAESIRTAARKQALDEHALKDKEAQEQTAALRKQIDDLKRKIEQGSQQAQGEALELILEEVLAKSFPLDEIDPVAKGVHGADILQRVLEPSGLDCGTILWETKNARKWSPAWLPKLREDQRDAKTSLAVLVTESMPPDAANLTQIDGVWVCTRACAIGLALALRAGLIEVAKSRVAADGKHGKIERVYDYLTSTQFRQRVSGIVEPLVELKDGLNKERRAMERIWAAREKQIDAAMLSTHGMYGDLQGIAGATLPTLEAMDLPQLEQAEGNG